MRPCRQKPFFVENVLLIFASPLIPVAMDTSTRQEIEPTVISTTAQLSLERQTTEGSVKQPPIPSNMSDSDAKESSLPGNRKSDVTVKEEPIDFDFGGKKTNAHAQTKKSRWGDAGPSKDAAASFSVPEVPGILGDRLSPPPGGDIKQEPEVEEEQYGPSLPPPSASPAPAPAILCE